MPFRQRYFAIVSLRHFSTPRLALPSAVECMYVHTSVKQLSCLILFTVQKTGMFLAGFVIILYHSAALQIRRFYLVLFWRARCAVYEITEDLREDAATCYPTPKTAVQRATYQEELFLACIRFLIHCGLWSLARDFCVFLRILYQLAGDCFKSALVLLGPIFALEYIYLYVHGSSEKSL